MTLELKLNMEQGMATPESSRRLHLGFCAAVECLGFLCWVAGLDATSAFIVTQGSTCWEANGYKQTSKGRYKGSCMFTEYTQLQEN